MQTVKPIHVREARSAWLQLVVLTLQFKPTRNSFVCMLPVGSLNPGQRGKKN